MRKKNDQRRQTILDAAYEVFRTKGFESASMSAIKAKAGGSRATIYSYFDSKEELFVECFALADAMHQGKLLQDDPVLVTLHFRALLEAELFEPCALAARPTPPGKEEVNSAADRAVTAFLRAYAPQAC